MKRRDIILLGFIVLKFLLQYLLVDSGYDLHRDTYLYLDQGNHLAWGYLSVPPFMSWVSYLIHLLGGSAFWVTFFPALFGALTILIVWKAVEELKGTLFALILSAVCVLFSTLLRLDMLYQPNSFDILIWTTLYFIVIKYFKTENTKWLYVAALVFGIGFLNKYNIIFLLIGLLPAVLLTRHRRVFVRKEFYFAVILGLLIILPNLIWQYKNDFPSVKHLSELTGTQLVNLDRLDFIKFQLFFFFGALPVIVSALYALLFYKPFEKQRAFFWAIVFTLFVFIFFRAKGYYAIGIYPIYIAFGSVFLGDILAKGRRRYLQPVLIIIPVLIFIPLSSVLFPSKTPEYYANNAHKYQKYGSILRWEDGKTHLLQQDFADMLGWKELAERVDSIGSGLNLDRTLILCDNYGQAGAINYYTENRKVTAYSYHCDYVNWIPLDKKIENVVLVKGPYDKDRERVKEASIFDTVYLASQRINRYAREDTISVYVLKGARVDLNKVLKDEVNQVLENKMY